MPKSVHPDVDESPCTAISHGDLAAQNIIVDAEYNIKGYVSPKTLRTRTKPQFSIIDWGFASQLPLQFSVCFPRFLAIEPPQIDTVKICILAAGGLEWRMA